MARWYQNVLTGVQVEVKTLDEDDFYAENAANWSRIPAPPATAKPVEKPAAPPVEKPAAKKPAKKSAG